MSARRPVDRSTRFRPSPLSRGEERHGPVRLPEYQQLLGDPNFTMSSSCYSGFSQDDWRLAPNFKISTASATTTTSIRGAPNAPPIYNQAVQQRQQQLRAAPRHRVVAWQGQPLGHPREHGHHFRPVPLAAYETGHPGQRPARAHELNFGPPRLARRFPNTLENLPAGSGCRRRP